jgi:hypothetical protein
MSNQRLLSWRHTGSCARGDLVEVVEGELSLGARRDVVGRGLVADALLGRLVAAG